MTVLKKSSAPGCLYIVATPIGNLDDMGMRAINILKEVNLIAAEDTRHSALMLKHFSITTPLISLHDYNEAARVASLIARLQQGESLALISDAGTPLVSDPGFILVQKAHEAGLKVIPIPGPCAAITALSAAGLPTERFTFEGFLPAKASARRAVLQNLREEERTLIFYEGPHRLLDTLQAMSEIFGGNRPATLARELTKLYETIRRGTLAELTDWVSHDSDQQRGELVIIVAGNPNPEKSELSCTADQILAILLAELPLKQAVALAATITGQKKNALYQKALTAKSSSEN